MNTLTDEQRDRILGLLKQGKSLRRIEHETGHRRETVAAYGRRAGLLASEVADLDAYRTPATVCEPYREQIREALETADSLRQVYDQLVERGAFTGSYSTLKRFVRSGRVRPAGTTLLLAA